MDMFESIPATDGLYWYCGSSESPDTPEPVLVLAMANGKRVFKTFSGHVFTLLEPGAYLLGPQTPPISVGDASQAEWDALMSLSNQYGVY